MRKAVRAILVKDDKLLVMKRNKFGNEYYTLLGGKIDFGESGEQAVIREVKEETGLDITNPILAFIEEAGNPYGTQYIYMRDLASEGEPKLAAGSIEAAINVMGQNLYEPMWVSLDNLPDLPFRSETLKQALLKGFREGFLDEPSTIRPTEDIRYNKKT